MPPVLSPESARQAIRTKPGLRVELVAAEPLIQSPVAIDCGADGTLWVADMQLESPNGTIRDMVQRMLVERTDPKVDWVLYVWAGSSLRTEIRAQAHAVLDGIGKLANPEIIRALDDPHPGSAARRSGSPSPASMPRPASPRPALR